jgi:hypothetical protein
MGRPRNDVQALAMRVLYDSGASLEQVGQAFGVARQSVYEMFRRRGWPLRSKVFQPKLMYRGESYALDKNGYLRATRGARRWMHQVVWEDHNGPIPAGHDIHHRDYDKTNNDPLNLQCLPALRHSHLHKVYAESPDQACLNCGAALVRKWQPAGRLETPAEVRRRLYCGTACRAAHWRGKPKGWAPRDPGPGSLLRHGR